MSYTSGYGAVVQLGGSEGTVTNLIHTYTYIYTHVAQECTVSYTSGYGAVVQLGGSEGTVTNCTMRDNVLATYVNDDASLSICSSVFQQNQAAIVVGENAQEAEVCMYKFIDV